MSKLKSCISQHANWLVDMYGRHVDGLLWFFVLFAIGSALAASHNRKVISELQTEIAVMKSVANVGPNSHEQPKSVVPSDVVTAPDSKMR